MLICPCHTVVIWMGKSQTDRIFWDTRIKVNVWKTLTALETAKVGSNDPKQSNIFVLSLIVGASKPVKLYFETTLQMVLFLPISVQMENNLTKPVSSRSVCHIGTTRIYSCNMTSLQNWPTSNWPTPGRKQKKKMKACDGEMTFRIVSTQEGSTRKLLHSNI